MKRTWSMTVALVACIFLGSATNYCLAAGGKHFSAGGLNAGGGGPHVSVPQGNSPKFKPIKTPNLGLGNGGIVPINVGNKLPVKPILGGPVVTKPFPIKPIGGGVTPVIPIKPIGPLTPNFPIKPICPPKGPICGNGPY